MNKIISCANNASSYSKPFFIITKLSQQYLNIEITNDISVSKYPNINQGMRSII
jgi:hypothetical protein